MKDPEIPKQTIRVIALMGLLAGGMTAHADVKLHRVFTEHISRLA